jgi:predicted metal-dependent hydrolase
MYNRFMELGEGGGDEPQKYQFTEKVRQPPRITEIPHDVEVSGFGEREAFIRRVVESVGLPLDNVSRITFQEASAQDTVSSGVLGSVHLETGELSFYKRLEGLPEIAQLGVAAHELAHENDPHKKENAKLYGSKENMQRTADNVKKLADQTKETQVFMNWYHKFLYQQLEAGNIDDQRFLRETHAIMIELRYTNPTHLQEVLVSQNKETANEIFEQLDNTLLTLMPHLNNSRYELNKHITSLHASFKK